MSVIYREMTASRIAALFSSCTSGKVVRRSIRGRPGLVGLAVCTSVSLSVGVVGTSLMGQLARTGVGIVSVSASVFSRSA